MMCEQDLITIISLRTLNFEAIIHHMIITAICKLVYHFREVDTHIYNHTHTHTHTNFISHDKIGLAKRF